MDYPIWNVPYLGGAMVIAIVAIIHVFIAHFAVGAGVLNALTETFSLRTSNPVLREFLRDNSRLIILFPFIGGALTGVALWFSIALVSPDASFMLIRLFLWAWAVEWVFFLVQIIAGYIYHYTWRSLSPRSHCFVGWIYAVTAFLSLFLINGILSFMLTPGGALDSTVDPVRFDFWAALFNPTYWPSLVMRAVGAVALGALLAMVLVNVSGRYSRDQQNLLTRHAGKFLIPMVLMVPAGVWYFARVPSLSLFYLKGGSVVMAILFMFGVVVSALVGLYSYIAIVLCRRPVNLESSLLLTALAFIAMGSAEFVREGIRKPYLIYGHMYSTGLLKSRAPQLDTAEHTMLRHARWAVIPQGADELGADDRISDQAFLNFDAKLLTQRGSDSTYPAQAVRGRWIYNAQCLRCHTLDGYNAVRPLVYKWPLKVARYCIDHLDEFKPAMPPFFGTIRDRQDISQYLHSLNGPCTQCHENVNDRGDLLDEKSKIRLKENWETLLP